MRAGPALLPIPPRSAPAQKARSPAPVRTRTRTASSVVAVSKASASSDITWNDMALWRSGRSIVTRATAPSTS